MINEPVGGISGSGLIVLPRHHLACSLVNVICKASMRFVTIRERSFDHSITHQVLIRVRKDRTTVCVIDTNVEIESFQKEITVQSTKSFWIYIPNFNVAGIIQRIRTSGIYDLVSLRVTGKIIHINISERIAYLTYHAYGIVDAIYQLLVDPFVQLDHFRL